MGITFYVLAEGQHQDLINLLNQDLLATQWPTLQTLISRPLRHTCESAFLKLASAGAAAAAA